MPLSTKRIPPVRRVSSLGGQRFRSRHQRRGVRESARNPLVFIWGASRTRSESGFANFLGLLGNPYWWGRWESTAAVRHCLCSCFWVLPCGFPDAFPCRIGSIFCWVGAFFCRICEIRVGFWTWFSEFSVRLLGFQPVRFPKWTQFRTYLVCRRSVRSPSQTSMNSFETLSGPTDSARLNKQTPRAYEGG
mgnify:CR=1 FL=1